MLLPRFSYSQTELFYENFNGNAPYKFDLNTSDMGSQPNSSVNKWIINNGYTGGVFFLMGFFPITIPDVPNQPAAVQGSPQSNYMHIMSIDAYNNGIENACILGGLETYTYFAKMNVGVNTVGFDEVKVSFYWICAETNRIALFYYSTNGGVSWTEVPGYSLQSNPTWLSFSLNSPEFVGHTDLRFAFSYSGEGTEDPALGIDEFKIEGIINEPVSITTGAIAAGPYCPGEAILVPFSVTGTPSSSNVFTAEISDANGNFSSPIVIGSLAGTATGVINGIIPNSLPPGNGYKIRVISSAPAETGTISNAITVNQAPTASILNTSTESVCVNGVATLNADGLGDIQWESSTTGTGFSPIASATGSTYVTPPLTQTMYYRVAVTNNCGTSNSGLWQVQVMDTVLIPVTLEPNRLNLCSGPVNVTIPSGFANIQWQGLSGTGESVEVSEPGSVRAFAEDQNGCPAASDRLDFILTEPQVISVNPGPEVVLCGAYVNLNASTGFTEYTWSNAEVGNPLTVTTPGAYFVRAKDANGCESVSDTINVVEGSTATITVTPAEAAICNNNPVTLTADPGYASYTWTGGPSVLTGQSITVSQSGTYVVTGVGMEGGCDGVSAPITIIKTNSPIANFNYSQNQLNISFNNTSQNGLDFSWYFDGLGTSTERDVDFQFTESGAYYVTLLASNGCGVDSVRKLVVVAPVGIGDVFESYGIEIFPNPTQSDFTVRMHTMLVENFDIELRDLMGRVVYSEKFPAAGAFTKVIPATNLSAGYYFLRIQAGDKSGILKLIKN